MLPTETFCSHIKPHADIQKKEQPNYNTIFIFKKACIDKMRFIKSKMYFEEMMERFFWLYV